MTCFISFLAAYHLWLGFPHDLDFIANENYLPVQRVGFQPETGTIEDMLQGFRDFKHRVPTYGGLLLNQDISQVLLVQVSHSWDQFQNK